MNPKSVTAVSVTTLVIAVAVGQFPIAPKHPAGAAPSGEAVLIVTRVVDGDTIEADVLLPWSVTLRKQMIRASDYDAWERSKRRGSVDVGDDEVAKGKLAHAELIELLATSRSVRMSPDAIDRDVYGRLLGKILVEPEGGPQVQLADWMRQHGHVRP